MFYGVLYQLCSVSLGCDAAKGSLSRTKLVCWSVRAEGSLVDMCPITGAGSIARSSLVDAQFVESLKRGGRCLVELCNRVHAGIT